MKWLRKWLQQRDPVQDFLAGKDGSGMNEYQKAVHLKKLTEMEGWGLLKAMFLETMRRQNIDMEAQSKNGKDMPLGAIPAKGLAMASTLLIGIERINLNTVKKDQKEFDEQEAEDRLETAATAEEE